ncbi:hypothetical protein D3C75_1230670 [compost metagenome]
MIRSWMPGMMQNAAMPQKKMLIIVRAGWCRVAVNKVMTTASTAKLTISEGISFQSASLPPTILPSVTPTPNRTRIQVT